MILSVIKETGHYYSIEPLLLVLVSFWVLPTIVILTNNFAWSAKTIAQIYEERWQIELFFKCIKQKLKVKSFIGTSRNALLSQLWVALITYLLLSYLYIQRKTYPLRLLCMFRNILSKF